MADVYFDIQAEDEDAKQDNSVRKQRAGFASRRRARVRTSVLFSCLHVHSHIRAAGLSP